jgi:hypothetical protein
MKIDGTPITKIGGNSAPYSFTDSQTTRFFLFYRTEQISSGTPVTIPSSGSTTSIWVDGNNTYGTSINSNTPVLSSIATLSTANYYTPKDNSIIRAASSITPIVNSNNFTMKVSSIPIKYSNISVYVYCRFGLPMNTNVTYDYVSMNIS